MHQESSENPPKTEGANSDRIFGSDRVTTGQALGRGAYVRKPYVIEKLELAVRKELEKT